MMNCKSSIERPETKQSRFLFDHQLEKHNEAPMSEPKRYMLVAEPILGYKKSPEEKIVRQEFARHKDVLKIGDQEVQLKTKIHHDVHSQFMTPKNRIDV